MDFDQFAQMALRLPETGEELGIVNRGGHMMFTTPKESGLVAVKLDWESRDRLLASRPEVFGKTPDDFEFPWLLTDLSRADESLALELIDLSYQDAFSLGRRRSAR